MEKWSTYLNTCITLICWTPPSASRSSTNPMKSRILQSLQSTPTKKMKSCYQGWWSNLCSLQHSTRTILLGTSEGRDMRQCCIAVQFFVVQVQKLVFIILEKAFVVYTEYQGRMEFGKINHYRFLRFDKCQMRNGSLILELFYLIICLFFSRITRTCYNIYVMHLLAFVLVI